MFFLVLWLYATVLGMAGIQIAQIKGYKPLPAFWIAFLFGILGLIYLSNGTPKANLQLPARPDTLS